MIPIIRSEFPVVRADEGAVGPLLEFLVVDVDDLDGAVALGVDAVDAVEFVLAFDADVGIAVGGGGGAEGEAALPG